MPAQLKVYSDAGHTTELAHTTNISTTINNAGGYAPGATSITLTSTTGISQTGYIDIIDATNGNETIPYISVVGNVVTLMKATLFTHPNSCVVNQWYYALLVGDQVNGIAADGTQSTPTGSNTATWYLYNAGDQQAQSPKINTVATSPPSTASGFADTLLSITSATAGFSNAVTPANMNAGDPPIQFWVCEEIPNGQSTTGNPQVCLLNIAWSSV